MHTLSIIGGLWLVVLAVVGSDAGVNIVEFYAVQGVGTAIAVLWSARFVRLRRRALGDTSTPGWPWLIVPAYVAVAVTIFFLDGPRSPLFQARFRLSEAALTRAAEGLLAAPAAEPGAPHRVGLFRVKRTEVVEGQVRFVTTSCGVVDACGLVYSPATDPTRVQEDVFTPLRGRWWHLFEGF